MSLAEGSRKALEEIKALPTNERTDSAVDLLETLPPTKQSEAVSRAGVPLPAQSVSDRLWTIVVSAFAIVLVGAFLALAFGVFLAPKTELAQMMLTVFTTTVGFLSGLFAPSPLTGGKTGRQAGEGEPH